MFNINYNNMKTIFRDDYSALAVVDEIIPVHEEEIVHINNTSYKVTNVELYVNNDNLEQVVELSFV